MKLYPPHLTLAWITILTMLVFSGACNERNSTLATSYGAQRTDDELQEVLLQACIQSNASNRPILLQLGADWCTDCRRVEALKSDDELQQELQNWVDVKVNVGQYDRHEWLIEHFSVTSIARWIAFEPNPETESQGCNGDPRKWTVIQDTVLEPISDAKSLKTAPEIIAWLQLAKETE
ncbi:MAG: thioredoxin family protein [Leptospiraceae bacterium]